MKKFDKFARRHMVNLLYLPALVMFGIFVFYPFLKGVRLSFTDWSGYSEDIG